ncbi:putative bifunctional diguanylate cyclase/phosphodiesterase [Paenibacillus sp. WLX1005]|uniref:putative bifunctional diguanylate cyclase/phosphodiesterase n=1 Tax=Paenibacillus sp. WLX1005 TaxID=3243766 RepID=UPI0039840A79
MYVFLMSLILSFIPFILLGFLAIEILLRHPNHPLHRLTMVLIVLLALIFLSDFLTQSLDFPIASQINPITAYVLSFTELTLLIYFFTILSRIKISGILLHMVAVVPLSGIVLMFLEPDVFHVSLIQGDYWRVELHSVSFDTMFMVIACYSLAYLLMTIIFGYRKLKLNRAYLREQQMMLTMVRGGIVASIWLIVAFLLGNVLPENPIVPLNNLPSYAGLILACTLRVAMNKYEFLAAAEQRYKLIFSLSSGGIALVNAAGIAVESNPAFRELAGEDDEQRDIDIFELFSEDSKVRYMYLFEQGFLQKSLPQNMQIQIINRKGVQYTVEVNSDFLEMEGEVHCYLLIRDITQQQKDEARLLELAYTDSLTGLANRYQFNLRLEEALERSRIYNHRVVVMQMDLDHFKWINDTMGHSAGDLLLINVARLIRQHAPENSLVARMGGDEFSLLVELPTDEDADAPAEMASHILRGFAKQIALREKYYHVSCSIGVCTAPLDGGDPETLLRNADTAMYAAKQMGRNQYQLFNETLKSTAEQYLMMQQGLETALENEEFSLVYQPQVDSETGNMIGAEALLRWHSAELGFVSPQDFIPIAEQSGMIRLIGEWVMQEAAEQAVRWMNEGYFTDMQMSVNVSASQLTDPYFAHKVETVLKQTGLPPQMLCLEFTESAAIREDEQIMALCNEIVKMGVTLAVDDFGTGYSSMRTVTSFPFHFIKIDRSLVYDIDRNPRNEAVVRSVLELAEQLGMKVLAEGVETQQHVHQLLQLGCHYIQGYYYSRPMKTADFKKWVDDRALELKRLEVVEDIRIAGQ